jgi:hypothetical protein
MHAPAVQVFLRWHQALPPEDRAAIDAFLVERGSRITPGSTSVRLSFGGCRMGATPACHQPLP